MNKTCTKCGTEYPATANYFYKDQRHKDGFQSACKRCCNLSTNSYYHSHVRECKEQKKKYRQKNKKKIQEQKKIYRSTLEGFLHNTYRHVRHRCTSPKSHVYIRYGGRGIKLCFTYAQLLQWVKESNIDPRSKDIHRIDNDGDYTLNNIDFIKRSEHISLHRHLEKEALCKK